MKPHAYLAAAILVCDAGVAGAQERRLDPTSAKPAAAPAWGVTPISYVQIPPASFRARSSTVEYNSDSSGQSLIGTNPNQIGEFVAGVTLPSGAQVVYLELDFRDESTVGEIGGRLVACDFLGENCTMHPTPDLTSTAAFDGGNGFVTAVLTADSLFVDNYLGHYNLVAYTTEADNTELRGMIVGYRLRVSPPPGSPSFNDVPTDHPFFQFVEALQASGITAGCQASPPLFCPDQALTRGQMAVFLSKALGLHFP